MMKHRGQVLITGKMEGVGFAQSCDCLVASGLRPTVGIKVGMQTSAYSPMNMSSSAKDGLGECDFHVRIGPVTSPFVKKLELTLTE